MQISRANKPMKKSNTMTVFQQIIVQLLKLQKLVWACDRLQCTSDIDCLKEEVGLGTDELNMAVVI